MAAATYTFGVDPAAVTAAELAFAQEVNDDLLERAIDSAAGDLNPELRAMRIDPTSITEESAVDDWLWCRKTIIIGAAGYYLRNASGAWDAGRDKLEAMNARIQQFIAAPQMLVSYNPSASSTATARSRVNHQPGPITDAQTRAARVRFTDPANPARLRY